MDEYRCEKDHVVEVSAVSGELLAIQGVAASGSLTSVRGHCPLCAGELATGLLPRCPVCGSRDHEVLVEGTYS